MVIFIILRYSFVIPFAYFGFKIITEPHISISHILLFVFSIALFYCINKIKELKLENEKLTNENELFRVSKHRHRKGH